MGITVSKSLCFNAVIDEETTNSLPDEYGSQGGHYHECLLILWILGKKTLNELINIGTDGSYKSTICALGI